MTCVFVPQDLAYLGLKFGELHALNPRLVPLIAHDRAAFGGAVCCCGLALLYCIWYGRPSRSLWQVLCLAGLIGFGTAVGVHPAVGYNDTIHLAPAVLGAALYLLGLVLMYRPMTRGSRHTSEEMGRGKASGRRAARSASRSARPRACSCAISSAPGPLP
jgi:hypothetical protein